MGKQQAKAVAAKMDAVQGTHIGSIAMWTLDGCEIKAGALKALFAKYGLDWDTWGPSEIDGDSAFTKALTEAKRKATGYRFVPLFDGADRKVVGIVREDVDTAAEDVDYDKDWQGGACKVTHDRINLAIKLSNPQHPIGQQVKALYTECCETYLVPDFVRLLTRNVTRYMDGVSLRSRGGAYFVPATHYTELVQHQEMLEAVSTQASMFVGNLKDDAKTVHSVGRDVRGDLLSKVEEVQEDLEKWRLKLPRRDTLGRRLEEYKDLEAKAQLYAKMLSIKADDIVTSLQAAHAEAGRMLGVLEEKADSKQGRKATPATPVVQVKVQAKVIRKVEEPVQPTKKAKVVRKAS